MHCSDIGVKVTHNDLANFLRSVKGGQFFIVKGYKNSEGEVSDYILRFGIRYDNLKIRDVKVLQEILNGKRRQLISVSHGAWIPDDLLSVKSPSILLNSSRIASLHPEDRNNLVTATICYTVSRGNSKINVKKTGIVNLMDITCFTNRKASGRTPCTISYSVESTHPLVVSAIGEEDLEGTLLQSLINPDRRVEHYEKKTNSTYSVNKNGKRVWYIRDVLSVSKKVRTPSKYEFSASFPINAVKEAIANKFLLTNKYRQFILTEGKFESITIAGQAILFDEVEDEFYFALPKDVKSVNETVNVKAGA